MYNTRIYSTLKNGNIAAVVTCAGQVTGFLTLQHASHRHGLRWWRPQARFRQHRLVTNTGECCNRGGCRHLSHSCIAMSLADAKAQG